MLPLDIGSTLRLCVQRQHLWWAWEFLLQMSKLTLTVESELSIVTEPGWRYPGLRITSKEVIAYF